MDTLSVDVNIDSRTLREMQRLTGARSQGEAVRQAVEAGVRTLRYEDRLKPRASSLKKLRQAVRGPLTTIHSAAGLRKAARL